MDVVTQALLALATLVQNPALGGGGLKSIETVRLIRVLVQLIQGGQKTARALREFTDRIQLMAETGYQPTERDFKEFEDRLAAALVVIEEAKERLEQRNPNPPAPEDETQDDTSNDEASDDEEDSDEPSDPPSGDESVERLSTKVAETPAKKKRRNRR